MKEIEYLIMKDQDGKTIKITEEEFRDNLELFQNLNIINETLPSWVFKYQIIKSR